jgi:hypothetical protein
MMGPRRFTQVLIGFSYRVARKGLFYVAAGFSLRLHRRDAGATL